MLSEIQIKVRFYGTPVFPARLVTRVVEHVDEIIYQTEREDFDLILSKLGPIPPLANDAARFRFAQHLPTAFHIQANTSGSLVLEGLVAGVAVWILSETLGETLKEAWHKSGLHKRLVKLLAGSHRTKANRIVKRLRDNRTQLWPDASAKVPLKAYMEKTKETIVIVVSVNLQATRVAPTYADVFRSLKADVSSVRKRKRSGAFRLRYSSTKQESKARSSDLPVEDEFI